MSLPENRHEPLELDGLKTMSIRERSHLVTTEDFARLTPAGASFEDFWDSLPAFLAARGLIELCRAIARAHRAGRSVIFGLGGHVIKVGLAPVIADLAERGIITAMCTNGATAIHDLEIALIGETSEKVAETIGDGRFGMIRETGEVFRRVVKRSREENLGFGRALCEELDQGDYPYREHSLIYRAGKAGVPVTIHVAIGNDTVHAVPGVDGADVGHATYLDFRIFAGIVTGLAHGVYVNVGSAVILPEVFLKSVSIARNLGHPLPGITSANFDMIQHYRPTANVLTRPVERGIAITGHHEINLPLLRIGVLTELAKMEREDRPAGAGAEAPG